jgi:hypothetical protein
MQNPVLLVLGFTLVILKSGFLIILAEPVNTTTKLLLEKNLVIPATTETGGKNERNTESKKEV